MTRLSVCGLLLAILGCGETHENWYERSFYLLHEDHHTYGTYEVGRDADPVETARMIALSRPDVIQIHAKGNPGWTTYPTDIGFTPPLLARDVLDVWRNTARRDGYHFSIYYNIGRDGEIMTRRPERNRVKADGTPYDRMLCYHSGVAEGYLWPMIREILAEYRPDGLWFDGSCFTVHMCYCEQCRDRFRREQSLNAPERPTDPGWIQYQEMQRQIYREFVRDTVSLIHALDPECLVAVNWAYSLRMPEKPAPGIAYLTGDIGNHVEKLSAEAHWCDSQDMPFDLMTQVNTLYVDAGSGGRKAEKRLAPKPRPQIEQEMAVIIANGGRYFAWDSPTPESGLVAERLTFLGEVVAPFLRDRQRWCLGSKRIPEVSLLHSAAAHYAIADKLTAVFAKGNNRIDGAADMLSRLHLNYEMIPDWRLAEQDIRSSMLIVEHPKTLADTTVESLVEYVRSGGMLLMTGMGPAVDGRIRDLCGIADLTSPQGPERLSAATGDGAIVFSSWLFRVKPGSAEPLIDATDAEGIAHPILLKNSFGRGRVFYAAIPLLSFHGENTTPLEFAGSVFERILPSAGRHVMTTAPEQVEVVLRKKEDMLILHLVNLAPGDREINKAGTRSLTVIKAIPAVQACHVSVRLPSRPSDVQLQPSGMRLEGWRYENGRLEVEVPPFSIHQMVVIKAGGSR